MAVFSAQSSELALRSIAIPLWRGLPLESALMHQIPAAYVCSTVRSSPRVISTNNVSAMLLACFRR
jgi:hypothetical protein